MSTQKLVDMLKNNQTVRRYSESFKLKILSELESGRYTKNEIIRIYGIGTGSLFNWIKKYGKLELLNKRVKVETMDEKDKLKKLEKEIKQLKELLIQKDINGLMNEAYLEYAAKRLGYKSVEELKKKLKL
jgi:transposase-like protein